MHPIVRLTTLALLTTALQGFVASPVAAQSASPGAAADAAGDDEDAGPSRPARNASFYRAEIAVVSKAEKRGALIRGLGQVVVRLTGNLQAPSNNVIRKAASNIDAFVTGSSFRQDSETVNGVPVYKTVLVATFDPDGVDALIGAAGLKFWTSQRPRPILWLAIDDGSGARLVTAKQTAVVKPLATRGLERGMRYLLPAGTAAELAAVNSIWNLSAVGVRPLTSRYRNDTQLVGKVYREGGGWAAKWLLTQGSVELARWSFADADPRRVIASGVDEGANAIARRDAVMLDTGAAGWHEIEIGGVNTQDDYIRLVAYLSRMAVVRKLVIVEATPQSLRLRVELGVGMKGFRTMIGAGGPLRPAYEPDDGATPVSAVPRFELQ